MYVLSFVLSFSFGRVSFDSTPCKVRLQLCGALMNSCLVSLFFMSYVWLNGSKCDAILCNVVTLSLQNVKSRISLKMEVPKGTLQKKLDAVKRMNK